MKEKVSSLMQASTTATNALMVAQLVKTTKNVKIAKQALLIFPIKHALGLSLIV